MKKSIKFGGIAVASTAIVIAIAVVLNIALTSLDYVYDLSVDFSSSEITEIDSVSTQILSRLTDNVEIVVNGSEDEYRGATYETQTTTDEETGETKTTLVYSGKRYTAELLDCYRKGSDKVTVEYIDTRYNPGFFKERNITLQDGVFITVYCPTTQRYSFIYDDVYEDTQYVSCERQIDAAIQNVTLRDIKKIGIVTGHNEEEFPVFEDMLRLNGFDVDLSVDITSESIAEDTDILVIVNPSVTYSSDDIAALRDFLYHDGKYDKSLCVFMDNSVPENPLLETFLRDEWGIEYTTETVFDKSNSSTVTDAYEPFLRINYGTSNAATGIAGRLCDESIYLKTSLGTTRAVKQSFEQKNYITTTPLLTTFDSDSFGRDYSSGKLEVNGDNFRNIEKRVGDSSGPHIVGAMGYVQKSDTFEDEYNVTMSSVLCFGTTSLLDTYYISNAAGYTPATSEYTLGIFTYVSHDDSIVKIVSSQLAVGVLEFDSDETVYTVAVICIALVPAVFCVLSIVIWRKRKYL